MLIFCALNDNIIDIEKSDEICSPTFVALEFSRLFLYPLCDSSLFFVKRIKTIQTIKITIIF